MPPVLQHTLRKNLAAAILGLAFLLPSLSQAQNVKVEAEAYSAQAGTQLETTTDTGGGQNVAFISNGDWNEYSLNIPAAGTYRFDIRVASDNSAGGTISFSGAATGSVVVPYTNGWQDWITVSTDLTFGSAGTQTLRFTHTGGSGSLYNVNWFCYAPAPLLVEAETFTAHNGVVIEAGKGATTDSIGYIDNGDWADYSINIPIAGTYRVTFSAASNGLGGTVDILEGGAGGPVIGTATLPDINSWDNWTDFSTTATFTNAGVQTIRLNFAGTGTGALYNIDSFTFDAPKLLSLVIGNTQAQKMRYGIDYERLWFWTGGLNGSERDAVARWSVVDTDADYVRVAINCGYELTEGVFDLSAYTNKIIPMMQEMQQANPNIKFFASPRPLDEAQSGVNWQPYPQWITGSTGSDDNYNLNEARVQKCAEYLERYILLMDSYGFKISFLDVTNEWDTSGRGSGAMSSGDVRDIAEYLETNLAPNLMPAIVAASSYSYEQGNFWMNSVNTTRRRNAIDVASCHNTGRKGKAETFAAKVNSIWTAAGEPVPEIWNTEVHGWKTTSSENETTSFYYYLEAIRAGFGGLNGWLAIGTTNQGHAYILNPSGTPTRNVKHHIFQKLSSTSNYGHALNILEEPDVFRAPLGDDDDDVPRNVAAFIKGNLMTVWVINENADSVPLEISPTGYTIAESTIRRTRWTDPSDVAGFVTFEPVNSGTSFASMIPGESVCCFEIVLNTEDFSNDRIEAEDFSHQWGTQTETTGDVDGIDNIGFINNGDFLRYGAIALTEDSLLRFRVARPGGRPDGFIEVREGTADGALLGTVAVPQTGNWQVYQTIETTLDVDAGIYNLYIGFVEDAVTPTNNSFVNFNWFSVNNPIAMPVTGFSTSIASATGIDLNWDAMPGATGYTVKRSLSEIGPFTTIASGVGTNSFNDTGLTPGTRYHYILIAEYGASTSPDSTSLSTVPSDPITPENYQITSTSIGDDELGGEELTLSIQNSGLGQFYQVQTTTNLETPVWLNLLSPTLGNGGLLDLPVPVIPSAEPERFYRIEVWREN